MWKALPLVLLALPGLACAAENCQFQAARNLSVNMAGVRTVVVRTGPYDFHVKAGNAARVEGRACASSQEGLDQIQLTQRREGDRLIITTENERSNGSGGWFGRNYAYLDVNITLPKTVALEVAVGSGDADVTGLTNVVAHVGSGDLVVRGAESLDAGVGSGDIKVEDIGKLELAAVGSGDVEGSNIRGDVRIGTIGSGDVDLRKVGGNVEARTIGSGGLNVAAVGGGLRVNHVGSGSVDHRDVKGRIDIPSED
ncbi:DUF4097 family beta strand repeat-containing protein [Luteimonas galliterrae]|nr:DUF4097 family beta strand repeat-containing protein [Luteimonas galliterrae]